MAVHPPSGPFCPGLLLEGETVRQLVVDDPDLEGCRLVDCTLHSVVLTGGRGDRTSWRGSRLDAVRLTGTSLARSSWLDVTITGSALSGCEGYGSQWRRVRFERCLIDSLNLRSAVLRQVVLDDCTVRHLDLGTARLTDVTFRDCIVERLDLTGATLSRVDLRGSRLDVARGFDRLAGAVVDPGQVLDLAPAMAAHLGLQVEPPDPVGGRRSP
jgi:uncharacterized protein YjbI with pentapeptide repeats